MSGGRLECVLGHTMTFRGQPMNKSVRYPSHTSLVLIHQPRRDRKAWFASREIRTRNGAFHIGCMRQLALPPTALHAPKLVVVAANTTELLQRTRRTSLVFADKVLDRQGPYVEP